MKEVASGDVVDLKYGVKRCMFHYLFLKCSVSHLFVRSVCCTDARMMANDPVNSKTKMKQVLHQLVKNKTPIREKCQ